MYALLLIDLTYIERNLENVPVKAFQINNFLDVLTNSIKPDTGDEKILESAFLFDIGNGLTNLRLALSSIGEWKIPYKILLLDDKPKFIT